MHNGFFRIYRFPSRGEHSKEAEGSGNNSLWAVIASFVKSFNVGIEYVLYEISYVNVLLYMATLPNYNDLYGENNTKKRGRGNCVRNGGRNTHGGMPADKTRYSRAGGDDYGYDMPIDADDPSNIEIVKQMLFE